MVTPIKRELLIHSVKYTPPLDDTGWDEPQPESQTVDNVRVEPKSSLYVDSAGKQVKRILYCSGIAYTLILVTLTLRER